CRATSSFVSRTARASPTSPRLRRRPRSMMIIAETLDYTRRICAGLASRWRNICYKALGVEIDGYVWMRRVNIPRNCSQIFLANGVALDEGVTLLVVGEASGGKSIVIGANTYINRDTF